MANPEETQTPLNNNIRELFNLMNFLDPDDWSDLEGLTKEFEVLNEDLIKELHERLRPYFLRRVKAEVLDLPPKVSTFPLSRFYANDFFFLRMKLLYRFLWHLFKRRYTSQS